MYTLIEKRVEFSKFQGDLKLLYQRDIWRKNLDPLHYKSVFAEKLSKFEKVSGDNNNKNNVKFNFHTSASRRKNNNNKINIGFVTIASRVFHKICIWNLLSMIGSC